jgi:hexosaminidase
LTRMIDAVYPESDVARQFANLVQSYIQGGYKDQAAEAQIRAQLTLWRVNDAKLQPVLGQSFLLQEDAPLSQNLSAVGAAGLQALDYLDKGQSPPDAWKTQQASFFEEAKKRQADLLLMVVATVQQIVTASAGSH